MKGLKIISALFIFSLYYILFCWIFGGDFGDPWDRLMKWARK